MKKKVVLGLSGGVDSSVSAFLLKEAGYEVTCLFMKNWNEEEDSECSAYEDSQDALQVASQLGLPFYVVNFEKEYMDRVFSYFLKELNAGRTPNPDVMCNQEIKFNAFLDFAMTIEADYIAMGHYARVLRKDGRSYLAKGRDESKDQSYFLSRIDESALQKSLFPIGDLQKSEVRKIAEEQGFITAKKKDSTGICFIGERNFDQFLNKHLVSEEGDIVDVDENRVIGRHKGLIHYTIGQRRGIGIGGVKSGEPWFVCRKDKEKNILYVCQGEDHPELFYDYLICKDFKWINNELPEMPAELFAKFRYRQPDIPVSVRMEENGALRIDFKQAVKAITPGQIAVLYEEELCLGGGIIERGARNEL